MTRSTSTTRLTTFRLGPTTKETNKTTAAKIATTITISFRIAEKSFAKARKLLQAFHKILLDQQQLISEQQQFIQVKQSSVNELVNKANCFDYRKDYVVISKNFYDTFIQRYQDSAYPTYGPLKAILAPNNANDVIESENNTPESMNQADNQRLQSDWNNLLKKLKLKEDHINDLKNANNDLRKETINQDSYSTGQLSKDIRTLHNHLDKFCNLKRGDEIIESEVKELLKRYGCQLIGEMQNNKNLIISGLLERHVIETIITKSNEYFKENNEDDEQDNDQRLEAKIVNRTEQLLELINFVPKNRTRTDEVSKTTSTKLRQQIYGVLGNRGFCNSKGDKEYQLIVKLRTEVAALMNRYCTFKKKKLSENEEIIEEIVRQVVNIFLFRLKVQEPVTYWKFFENKTCINTMMMEASLDNIELENVYVDVCSFPIIGSNLCEAEEENKDLKVIFPVQIIPTNLY
ncbi:42790_t:CDS:2 [Gigaspora margarita]|uniref:42790_t:CDS:1 n=1 Tax=Gigaspora margarita TaxID=4874 RepID=A0ABN7W2A9_GIGMA|nr:42790_t:CDS:2 [Gigaspora margarita]